MNIVEQNLRSYSEDALKTLKEMCNEMEDETEMIEELNNYFEAYQELPTTAEMANKETETEIPEGEVEADATKENQPPSPNITILNVVTVKSCSNVNVTTTTTTSTSNQQSEQPVPTKSAQPEIPDETEEPAEDEESSDDLGKFNCQIPMQFKSRKLSINFRNRQRHKHAITIPPERQQRQSQRSVAVIRHNRHRDQARKALTQPIPNQRL